MRVTAQSLKDCLSESFLQADYHLSLLCSHMDQRSLLPLLIICLRIFRILRINTPISGNLQFFSGLASPMNDGYKESPNAEGAVETLTPGKLS